MKLKNFLIDTAKGAAIGVSMIIPGVSGGTLAVLLNVYEKIIDAVTSLRREFKKSVLTLLPFLIGAIASPLIISWPIKFALEKAPIPTVLFFTGLMIGSCPNIFKGGLKHGFKKIDIITTVIPLLTVVGICFLTGSDNVDLSSSMQVYMWFLLILVGILASCALVIPGISGSMLLLIIGFYPIEESLTFTNSSALHSILVLAVFAIGIVIGFFPISKIMKYLLEKFPRGTRWAIIGFAFGSIPAIFVTYRTQLASSSLAHILIGVALCLIGAAATFALMYYFEKREKATAELGVSEIEAADDEVTSESDKNDDGVASDSDNGVTNASDNGVTSENAKHDDEDNPI